MLQGQIVGFGMRMFDIDTFQGRSSTVFCINMSTDVCLEVRVHK